MRFYRYRPDGFTLAEMPAELVPAEGEWEDQAFEAAGWRLMARYGTIDQMSMTVYEHVTGEGRGFYAELEGPEDLVWRAVVEPEAWPLFFRNEVLPVISASSLNSPIAYHLERIANAVITAVRHGGRCSDIDDFDGRSAAVTKAELERRRRGR